MDDRLFGTAVGAGVLFLPINAGQGSFYPLIIMALLVRITELLISPLVAILFGLSLYLIPQWNTDSYAFCRFTKCRRSFQNTLDLSKCFCCSNGLIAISAIVIDLF